MVHSNSKGKLMHKNILAYILVCCTTSSTTHLPGQSNFPCNQHSTFYNTQDMGKYDNTSTPVLPKVHLKYLNHSQLISNNLIKNFLSPVISKQILPDHSYHTNHTKVTESSPSNGVNLPKELHNNNNLEYRSAYVSGLSEYLSLYKESIQDPSTFWLKMSSPLFFKSPPVEKPIFQYNFDKSKGPIYTRFMANATTNVSYNCIDVHVLNGLGDKVALIWEPNDPSETKSEQLTYGDLLVKVSQFANGLLSLGVAPGNVVAIYMPNIPETAIAMLACIRIAAVHSVIFPGFSAESLADRLIDGNVRILITVDGSFRGSKYIPFKETSDEAMHICEHKHNHKISACIVVNHLQRRGVSKEIPVPIIMLSPRDIWWDDLICTKAAKCPPLWVGGETPLFLLYTSGSTGQPKGIIHTTAGYLVFASTVFKYSFDFRPKSGDVFWGTSDLGWCAAHTNILYGPLSLGGTTLIVEGTPFYPSNIRPWELIDKYRVTQFYTAPTVIRHLMKSSSKGQCPFVNYSGTSLRVLGSVGEPLHPKTSQWFFSAFGNCRCPIVDTYGQTETGGHLLTSIPGTSPIHKPLLLPFFGVVPKLTLRIHNNQQQKLEKHSLIENEGCLSFTHPWPAIARNINNDKDNLKYNKYFDNKDCSYSTGDVARRNPLTGGYTILGRVDDMLNVSGHLIGTAQIETALMTHPLILEACVVAVRHETKGQTLVAFVVPNGNHLQSQLRQDTLIEQFKNSVRVKVGSFAVPDVIVLTPALPFTKSGKVFKRLLSCLIEASSLMNKDNNNNKQPPPYYLPLLPLIADLSVIPVIIEALRNHIM